VETGFAQSAGRSGEEAATSLPKIMWVPAEKVARAAVDGLAAGRAVVIPGAANRVAALAGYLAPRSWMLPLMVRRHPGLQDPPP